MIHFTCDCCKRVIDLDEEVRFVVRMEVFAAADSGENDADEERDYLQEIEEMLSCSADTDESLADADDVYQQARFDLCGDCRQRFIRNPLGRMTPVHLGFSNN